MTFHLQFRRYRLPLRVPVRTAHDVCMDREGILLRVEDGEGHCGYGEVAPIPAFGTETVDTSEAALRGLGEWPTEEPLNAVPLRLACTRHAIAIALAELRIAQGARAEASVATEPAQAAASVSVGAEHAVNSTPAAGGAAYRAVAALLPAGRAALEQISVRVDAGFRTFKWKVGVGDPADELGWLDELCAALPTGARLRLDANGAWDRRQAERWLDRCAERPIEYVEQPCFAARLAGETAARRVDDILLGLANDYPTPIALDESVIADGDVDRWLNLGWPGWFVIKPSLLGDVAAAAAKLQARKATVVFSSALETLVGARSALQAAFAWGGESKALGFGVWPLFRDPRFDGPAAAPFIRKDDIARLDSEAAWNALS